MFKIFRLLACDPKDLNSVSDDFLLADCCLPHPLRYIDAERIGLFARVVKHRNRQVLNSLAAAFVNQRGDPRNWLESVMCSLALASDIGVSEVPIDTVAQVAESIRTKPKLFAQRCRKKLLTGIADPYVSLRSPDSSPIVESFLHVCVSIVASLSPQPPS